MSESETVALRAEETSEFSSFVEPEDTLNESESEITYAHQSPVESVPFHSLADAAEESSTNKDLSPGGEDTEGEERAPNSEGQLLTADLVVCQRGNKIGSCDDDEFTSQRSEEPHTGECQRTSVFGRLEDETLGQGSTEEKPDVPVTDLAGADRKKKLPAAEVKKTTEASNGVSRTKPKTVAGVVIQNVEKPPQVQPVHTKVILPSTRGHVEELRKKLNSPASGVVSSTFSSSAAVGKKLIEVTPKGHLKDMKDRIERTMSSASSKRTTTPSQQKTDITGLEQPTPPPEEKRRMKAQEWMKKVQLSGDGGDHPPGSPGGSGRNTRPTVGTGSAGVRRSTSWKVREDQLKSEMEERKAAQKQLEEKRQRLAEERQANRDRKQKEDSVDSSTKGVEHQVKIKNTSTEPKHIASKAEKITSNPEILTSTTFSRTSAKVPPAKAVAAIQVDNAAAKKKKVPTATLR